MCDRIAIVMEWRQLFVAAARSRGFHAWMWLAFAMNLASWAILAFKIFPLRGERQAFVLHATVYFGIDRIGPWTGALVPPTIGLGIFAGNIVIAALILPHHRPLAHLLGVGTTVIEAVLLLSILQIMRLNAL